MKRTIEKTLVLSTGHISQKDADALEATIVQSKIGRFDPYPFKVVDHGEGWMIHVPDNVRFTSSNSESYITSLDSDYNDLIVLKEFTPEFGKLLNIAQDNKCHWINLDRDVETEEDLTTFEW